MDLSKQSESRDASKEGPQRNKPVKDRIKEKLIHILAKIFLMVYMVHSSPHQLLVLLNTSTKAPVPKAPHSLLMPMLTHTSESSLPDYSTLNAMSSS